MRKKATRGGRRPGAGRKPIGDEPMRLRTFLVGDPQRERWQLAAKAAGLPLSEWLRAACDRAADEQLGQPGGAK